MSDSGRGRVSTGSETLDALLDGGYPANRSVLVTGEPGTGKSTLGMQFLQEGLSAGDRCLYVSTEQTVEEVHDAFAGFDFDLEHPQLGVASIHATPGEAFEGEEELTLDTLFEDEDDYEGFTPPFEDRYIQRHLERFSPRDRVVFDSVSALAAISDREHVLRRVVLDLIRLFSDEFGATSLFVAESVPGEAAVADGSVDALQFGTHGVLTCWREPVADDLARFLRVTKMRGVDHDDRAVEVTFGGDGLHLDPARPNRPQALDGHTRVPVGVDGLDALCGGGLLRGSGVLLQHDGRADLDGLLGAILAAAIDRGETITLVPPIQLRPARLRRVLDGHGHSLEALLEADRLFVFDVIGAWDPGWPNVFESRTETEEVRSMLAGIAEQAADPQYGIVSADAIAHVVGAAGARRLRYFQESSLLGPEDGLLHVQNPDAVAPEVAALYVDAADQVLSTRLTDDGRQYLTLEKSPTGHVGTASLVEPREGPPYVAVQGPPSGRANAAGGSPEP